MKIGEVYRSVLSAGEQRFYRFILDEYSDLTVTQTVSKDSEVNTQLTFHEFADPSRNVLTLNGSESRIIAKDDEEKFRLETVYYVLIKAGLRPCEFSIEVTQERSIHQLRDGVPKVLIYNGPKDISKFMLINLPGPH